MALVSIQNLTRRSTPRVPFAAVAREVLPGWEISLVFVGEKRAQDLNTRLRRKSYTPNVLSYTAGPRSGEIIICYSIAAREAPRYGLSATSYLLLLFIHGLLHIKGWSHGATMEKCEQKLLTRYEAAYRHRHRHRHVPDKDGRRRRAV